MAIDGDPSKVETTLVLRDGGQARVRSIRPADANLDRAFFAGLSKESRYLRFMQHLPELTPQLVRQFTQIDASREMALVALDGDSEDAAIVGIARYVAPSADECESGEFAIVIADDWQGRGLGRALMSLLINGARLHGLCSLTGSILAVNVPMRALATTLGFAIHVDPGDPRHVIATLDLAPA